MPPPVGNGHNTRCNLVCCLNRKRDRVWPGRYSHLLAAAHTKRACICRIHMNGAFAGRVRQPDQIMKPRIVGAQLPPADQHMARAGFVQPVCQPRQLGAKNCVRRFNAPRLCAQHFRQARYQWSAVHALGGVFECLQRDAVARAKAIPERADAHTKIHLALHRLQVTQHVHDLVRVAAFNGAVGHLRHLLDRGVKLSRIQRINVGVPAMPLHNGHQPQQHLAVAALIVRKRTNLLGVPPVIAHGKPIEESVVICLRQSRRRRQNDIGFGRCFILIDVE